MSERYNPCPVGHCPAHIGAGDLICRTHWSQLPEALRDAITRDWNAGDPTPEYWRTMNRALDALDQRGGTP